MQSLSATMLEPDVPAATVGGHARPPTWPGWRRAAVLVAANALQVVLT